MKKIITMFLILSSLILNAQTDSINCLSEVNITSVRAKKSDPIAQTNIDMKLFRSVYQGQDIPLILNFSNSSITFYSDNGCYNSYIYYRFRGVDQTRINTTLNGISLNEPEDQGAYFSNFPDFFSNISSIQIQKGVGTSSNGTSSFVGSLNFQSPSLTDSAYTKIELGKGSFNTNRYSMVVNTGMKNGFGTYIRYSNIGSDGYREKSSTLGNTLFLSTGYQDSKNILKYTMFYGTSRNKMAWMPSNEADIKLNRRNNPLSKDENDYFIQNMHILSYSYLFNRRWSSNITAFYNHLQGEYGVNLPPISTYKLKSDYYGLLTNFNYNKNKISSSFGVSISTYSRGHERYDTQFTSAYSNVGRKDQSAMFYKITYKVLPKLSLYTDLQYRFVNFLYRPDVTTHDSDANVINWVFFNPKFGFNYDLNSNSRVFGYLGISHREPTRTDMFNSYVGIDPDHLPKYMITNDVNNGVKPETVFDYEMGWDYLNGNHKISTNLFYMYFENALLPIGKLNYIGLPINTNVSRSYRTGLEADYTYSTKHFKFYIGTTIMTSRMLSNDSVQTKAYLNDSTDVGYYITHYTKNKQMLLTPNLVVNSNIQYMFGRYSISLFNKYVSESYLTNYNYNGILPSYIVTNLNVNCQIKKLNIGFNINNLFNRDYYNAGQYANSSYGANPNAKMTQQFFVAAPRNYFVNLSYIF